MSISTSGFIASRKKLIGALVLLAPIVVGAFFAPELAHYGPLQTGAGPNLVSPSGAFPMGTDQLGEDVYTQMLYGAGVALYVGVTSALITVAIALVVGLVAGYVGRKVDEVLMRFTDVILSIPSFILIIFVVILFGANINTISLIIGLASWPPAARIIRAQVISLKEREFVLAGKAMGAGSVDVMAHEIFPNIGLAVIPAVALQIGYGVLTEAGLSFLGLGDPNVASWGKILQLASTAIFLGDWWSILFPGVAIIMTILGFNLLGNAVVSILNPRSK